MISFLNNRHPDDRATLWRRAGFVVLLVAPAVAAGVVVIHRQGGVGKVWAQSRPLPAPAASEFNAADPFAAPIPQPATPRVDESPVANPWASPLAAADSELQPAPAPAMVPPSGIQLAGHDDAAPHADPFPLQPSPEPRLAAPPAANVEQVRSLFDGPEAAPSQSPSSPGPSPLEMPPWNAAAVPGQPEDPRPLAPQVPQANASHDPAPFAFPEPQPVEARVELQSPPMTLNPAEHEPQPLPRPIQEDQFQPVQGPGGDPLPSIPPRVPEMLLPEVDYSPSPLAPNIPAQQPAGNMDLSLPDPNSFTSPAASPLKPIPDPVAAPQPAGPKTDEVFQVNTGDNFWTISRRYYGTARFFSALAKYNEQRIRDPNKLKPGMFVLVPDVEVLHQRYPQLTGGGPEAEAAKLAASRPGFFVDSSGKPAYRVGKGDTLTEIAQKHLGRSTAWIEIYALNKSRIPDKDALKIGTVLVLPDHASQVAVAPELDALR